MDEPLSSISPPSDVCLLLRADAEQSWLHREVIPVLRELEARQHATDEECGAALAYLEAMWSEATIRARATDAAHGDLRGTSGEGEGLLSAAAARYHGAVRVLRELVAARVGTLVRPGEQSQAGGYTSAPGALAEASAGGGRAPWAA